MSNKPYPEPHKNMECETCTTGNMATCVYTDKDGTDWYICDHCDQTEQAVQAGIPRSVAEGKTKLSDHFSKEYINWKCNRGGLNE